MMKTEQEQRRAIRQILFGANDICQATPCENEYCIYHGDYRCYDNVIVDKLIRAGYGDVSEYKAEIERLKEEIDYFDKFVRRVDDIRWYVMGEPVTTCKTLLKYIEIEKKQAKIDVLNKLRSRISDRDSLIQSYIADGCLTIEDMYTEIDELIAEVEDAKSKGTN